MTIPKAVTVTLPLNFNKATVPELTEFRSDKRDNLYASMCYILHSLIQMDYRKDLRDEFEKRGYYSLHSDILGSICGKRYTEALELLEQHQVIEVDPNSKYQVGKYAKGYRLIGEYSGGEIKFRPLIPSGVKNRYRVYLHNQFLSDQRSLKSITYITQWLDPKRLSIDVKLAHLYLERYLIQLESNVPERLPKTFTKAEVTNRITQRYNSANLVIRKILAGNFSPSRHGTDHRLHSTFSSFKKELRTLITFDGEQLVSLDLTASQPYLFTQLFNPNLYKRENCGWSISERFPELYHIITQEPYASLINDIIMSVTYAKSEAITGLQSKSFTDINWNEDFYEYLMATELSVFGPKNRAFINRKPTKKSVMFLLYDKSSKKYSTRAFKRFQTIFPREAALIRVFDCLPGDNYLPILLQRLESYLMLDVVGRAIADQIPDAPLITVHDSFLTTPNFVESVLEVMKKSFLLKTGIEPGIKIEPYLEATTIAELEQTAADDLKDLLKQDSHGDKKIRVKLRNPLSSEIPEYGDKLYIYSPLIKRVNKMKRDLKLLESMED